MKISVIGTGYVGLVTGICLSAKGHDVTCLDVRSDIVDTINSGVPHIYEKGLKDLLQQVISKKKFRARVADIKVLENSQIIILAVSTPSTEEGKIDLTNILEAARLAGRHLKNSNRFCSVVVRSTVIPGTTDTIVRQILETESKMKLGDFGLGMNPEFLREGEAVQDFMKPDRIVLGHEDEKILSHFKEMYELWDCDRLIVNCRTAEMIKYASNCLLATQISVVNELANIASGIGGVDTFDVMRGIHLDGRWNPIMDNGCRVNAGILAYLWPGCGFGGSCFSKDVQALCNNAEDVGVKPRILNAVIDVNKQQPLQVVALLESALGSLEGKSVLILGLAFKPDTDDIREAPSLKIIRNLLRHNAQVYAHDPVAWPNVKKAIDSKRLRFADNWQVQLTKVDAVVLVTPWRDYDILTSEPVFSDLNKRLFIDARGRFSLTQFSPSCYRSIGYRSLI